VQIQTVGMEVHDRIPHELAGSVVGHVASALDLDHVDPTLAEPLRRSHHMSWIRAASERDHRFMLDE